LKHVELYGRVRHAVLVDGMSRREAARVFGINRRTVEKMLMFSIPPGYRRDKEIRRPKLDGFTGIVDQILEADKLVPKKQRYTSKRVFERLRDEHGFAGGITIVKDYIFAAKQPQREMFVPLSHPPGHARADFGEALAIIGGVERKIHFLVMDLPNSDACFLKAYPAETTEAFRDAHVAAFAFFGGVPVSILYDNTRIAVARILGDGQRKRTRVFSELVSHYLFEDRFGRPGKGNDKGKVEGMVGYTRRNFVVENPSLPALMISIAIWLNNAASEWMMSCAVTRVQLGKDLRLMRNGSSLCQPPHMTPATSNQFGSDHCPWCAIAATIIRFRQPSVTRKFWCGVMCMRW